MIAGILGKAFLIAADAMPPLPSSAGWFTTFLYNFVQKAASNSAKVVRVPPTVPPTVPTPV